MAISVPETLVEYVSSQGVAVIELRNPPANAFSYEMMLQFDRAILEARMDDGVGAVVVRGGGDQFFSAGADIALLQSMNAQAKYYFVLHLNETLTRLEQTPKLVIAAINGHAVGGGFEIALACDLRVARCGASAIGLPEVALGVLPSAGGTQRLARAIGKGKAMELMVEGKNISVEEALELQLVNYVFGHDTFWDEVMEYARQFVPPTKASLAVGSIKRSVQSGLNMSLAEGLALERELQHQLFQTSDAQEGLDAFVAKRTPSFIGR